MALKFENPGYVYIISNESFPDLLKIGFTKNSPHYRAQELYTTGLPKPFIVENYYFVEDACMCEELIHIRLSRSRVNNDREFFKVDINKARRVVEQAIDDMRERIWATLPLKNEAKNESIILPQFSYNNPKFKEMIKVLKTSKKLLTVEEIAKELKISAGGVDKLLNMMNKQDGSMLYSREENRVKKYAMSLGFNNYQLKLLAEKFPDLNLLELSPLFENKKKFKNEYERREPDVKKTYGPNRNSVNKNNSNTPRQFLQDKINQENLAPVLVGADINKDESKKVEELKTQGMSKLEKILGRRTP
jgi:hypothetical protein